MAALAPLEVSSPLLFAVSALHLLATAGAIIYVLRHPREPRAMLAWILTFLLIPFASLILFFFIGDPKLNRVRRRRSRHRQKLSALSERLEELQNSYTPTNGILPYLLNFIATATRASRQPPTTGNQVEIYHDGKQTFDALLTAIQTARNHIHLQYYILRPDHTGCLLRDILAEKSHAGVECRILLDYIGSWGLPRRFLRSLRDNRIQVSFFLPWAPWRWRWRVNLRNHRKIAVIDGQIGFTGSQNIGNEYLGMTASWQDTHLRLTGPAVHKLQEIFVEDWFYATHEDLSSDTYFPLPARKDGQIVQIIPSGPDADTRIMHHLLLGVIAAARFQIAIITPYFVPDAAMVLSLQAAAYRGVQVQLLIPLASDHRLVLWAGRSYYTELCAAGVEIYEYAAGMVHSKVVIIDGAWAMVGSANMDERSFRLNFEISTLLYERQLARQLLDDFIALRSCSSRILPESMQWNFGESLLLGAARLASPLL